MTVPAARPFADDVVLALDPCELLRRNQIEPDPWQTALLRSRAPRVLVVSGRQQGKSTALATLALHTVLFNRGVDVVAISKSLNQSRELLKRIKALHAPFADRWRLTSDTAGSIALGGGSRVVCIPAGDSSRGYSPVLLLLDEAAFFTDEAVVAALPLVAATGGRIVAASTPSGRRNWFFATWHDGGDAWERIRVAAADNPRLDAGRVASDRQLMGEARAAREFDAEFRLDEDVTNPRLLSPDAIERAFARGEAPEARDL